MPNLYGVSNPIILPVQVGTVGGSNVTCNAGVETIVATSSPLVAISAGVYYPYIVGALLITTGATGPTGVTWAARIGAGADFLQVPMPGGMFGPTQWIQVPIFAVGPAATVPWQGTGSTLSVMLTATAQNITVQSLFTNLWMTLYRAPDQ